MPNTVLIDSTRKSGLLRSVGVKVAHMSSVHAPNDTRILYKECATLAEAGYDVVLIARRGTVDLPVGVRYHAVPAPRNRLERFTRTLWNVYRAALEERADIYHFHDPELVGVALALRRKGKSVIFDVHEDIPADIAVKSWIWKPLRPVVSSLTCSMLRAIRRTFTAVVAATPSIADSHLHQRTVTVQNFPRVEELRLDENAAPYQERPPNAIYIGSITSLRGAERMVQAIAEPEIPDEARLLLVGEFEHDGLRTRLHELAGWKRTTAFGHRSRAELPAILSQARVALLVLQPVPDHPAALPTKLLEYMAVGLPVVVSQSLKRCCQIVESVGCGIVVDSTNSKEIAEAVAQLLRSPNEAHSMGERGCAAVRERFAWSGEGSKLLALYGQIRENAPHTSYRE